MPNQIESLISNLSPATIQDFFKDKISSFRTQKEELNELISEKDYASFSNLEKLGEAEFEDSDELIVISCKYEGALTESSSKKKQYEIARKVIKSEYKDAAIFVFYDDNGKFRFSFIRTNYLGEKKTYSTWKRYTYFVDPAKPNKTFRTQLANKGKGFSSIEHILKAFSIDAVTDDFYKDFLPQFDLLADSVIGVEDDGLKKDFALLFVIRIIFIGFVQKRGWLDQNQEYVQELWKLYNDSKSKDEFYKYWLEPIFFEALNSPPGQEVKYQNNPYPKHIQESLKMAPYLNGELFKRKNDLDNKGYYLPDSSINKFFEFIFSYNFTIEENTNFDEDLELNPEFLGIIFERLVNKEDGAIYTPRTEVDFMCRLSLVKWLQKVSDASSNDLYHLFFIDEGDESDQKQGDFSPKQIEKLITLLKSVSICDPASGSGAFPVGMMQVLNEIIHNLQERNNTPDHLKNEDPFERKKLIIANSLYGVEVKQWAVWINQLRLWLSLFVDIPKEREDEFRFSPKPLLPNLDFKIRCGDSLVQRIGEKQFPIQGHAALKSGSLKSKITQLKKDKIDFFFSKSGSYNMIRKKENEIFKSIIDEQVLDLKKEIQKLVNPKGEQTIMFEVPTGKQGELPYNQKRLDELHGQINKLTEELHAFHEDHPLIWNIEFAEIFFDKGGFDIIIGNPPYVRQEDIADPNGRVTSSKAYKDLLEESIRLEYPKHFVKKEKINGKSDLYSYFYVKSLRLLNENGLLTFICSNSWLDVGYGVWQQKFMLSYCPDCWIIDNHAKRSFASADVNTIISLIDTPVKSKRSLDPNSKYRFIAFKKPFEDSIISNHLIDIETQKTKVITNETYRSYSTSIKELLEVGSDYEDDDKKKLDAGSYIGDKWGGKYLRTPDFIFEKFFINDHKDIHLLSDVTSIKFGVKTGSNDFFYLKPEEAKSYNIESKFLHRAILKTNELKIPNLELEEPKGYFFSTNLDKAQLKGTKALDYIKEGEKTEILIKQGSQKGNSIIGFQNISSIAGRKPWYNLNVTRKAPILWIIAHNDRSISFKNTDFVCSDNFFEIYPNDDSHSKSILNCLNSTYITLFRELYGRTNFGGGVLKTQKPDIEKFPVLLNIDRDFELLNREAKSIFQECGIDPLSEKPIISQKPSPLKDRKELDDYIYDVLMIPKEERIEIYKLVCQLVWNRLNKANSLK